MQNMTLPLNTKDNVPVGTSITGVSDIIDKKYSPNSEQSLSKIGS